MRDRNRELLARFMELNDRLDGNLEFDVLMRILEEMNYILDRLNQ